MADDRLESFSLIVSDLNGNVQQINTVPYTPGSRELHIGELPVGDIGRLTLVGYSDTNQVLAYSESGGFAVEAYDDILVSLPLRKPYTYLAGGPAISVFDNTLAHSGDVVSPIELNSPGQTSTAVATTPDGRYVLTAVADPVTPTASNLLVFNTGQHTEAYRVPLNYSPDYLSVSHDGHWAILSATDASRITVVDMEQVFAGVPPASTTQDIVFVAPRRAAFVKGPDGRDLAVILRDPLPIEARCTPTSTRSSLSVIELPDGNLLNTTYFDTALADIASRPGDSRVFLADPCTAQISYFETTNYQLGTLVSVQVPRSLIATSDTLWIGSLDESPDGGRTAARIAISKVDLSSQSPILEAVLATPFVEEGNELFVDDVGSSSVVLRANPRTVTAYHLSIPPGASRVSALVYATYKGDYTSAPLPSNIGDISTVNYESHSYVRLDTSTGEIRRRFRGYCTTYYNGDKSVLYCCEPKESFLAPLCADVFKPASVTSLFGVP